MSVSESSSSSHSPISNPLPAATPARAGALADIQTANPHGDRFKIHNLDDYSPKDPFTAIQEEFQNQTKLPWNDKLKDFKFKGGFKSPNDPEDGPIKVSTFGRGGNSCYCFTRHWTVSFTDEKGNPQEIHFSKTIFTNVEVPRNYKGNEHEQKTYLAALAARTYAKVVESDMKNAAGHPDELYSQLKDHMTKIRRARFVTLEMAQGGKPVTINNKVSSLKGESVKNTTINQVRIRINPGDKKYNETVPKEGKEFTKAAYIDIDLKQKGPEFKQKNYRLTADEGSERHIQDMAYLEENEEILKQAEQTSPEEALKQAGLDRDKYAAKLSGTYRNLETEYNREVGYCQDKEGIERLMNRYGNKRKLSDATLSLLPSKSTSKKEKFKQTVGFSKTPSQNKLGALEALAKLDATKITKRQLEDIEAIYNAFRKKDGMIDHIVAFDVRLGDLEDSFRVMKIADAPGKNAENLRSTLGNEATSHLDAIETLLKNAKQNLSQSKPDTSSSDSDSTTIAMQSDAESKTSTSTSDDEGILHV